ncbi:hypothetical protein BGZ61DRAFT_588458 [Ilyonectria robusta]|uniref:uncharacterized protein n=1 Tax=Ilyonectria robusta TaxID=1079257 RepID=UPI001E8E5C8C|nr:uncharacterized protein BGZ61DRAFT_588458 [Ilyonectria robusta]KAH8694492.1 hypothetical protein BGZ61DRAFT_588458 [Ilyonectria robusta]
MVQPVDMVDNHFGPSEGDWHSQYPYSQHTGDFALTPSELPGPSEPTITRTSRDEPHDPSTSAVLAPSIPIELWERHQNDVNASPDRPRRAKYENLDWERHEAVLRSLYIDKNKSLADTMKIMEQQHSFNASQKLYKEKFKEWGWQKNLPVKYAQFMTEKAKKRMREDEKETIFMYGGQSWTKERAEKSASRAKKTRREEDDMDIDTPEGVSYKTPKDLVVSPNDLAGSSAIPNIDRSPEQGRSRSEDVVETESPDSGSLDQTFSKVAANFEDTLPLRWNGLSRGDLIAMWDSGKAFSERNDWKNAEKMFLQATQGHRHILGSTHEDTVKAAYVLANLYAESDRMVDADKIIEDVTHDLISKLGHGHKRTQQHIRHAVELLNGWHREEDALGFLAHSKELLQTTRKSRRPTVQRLTEDDPEPALPGGSLPMTVSDVTELVSEDASTANLDFGLGFSRSHVVAKDPAVEGLLLQILRQCQLNPSGLAIQHLKAQSELLSLYEKLGIIDERPDAFNHSEILFREIWNTQPWDEDEIRSFEVLEAGLQLAATMFKCAYEAEAKTMFKAAEAKSKEQFGNDDERTIWTLISTGLVYQTYASWDVAEPCFESAFARALSTWSDKDGIVKSLQRGLDKKHFSYVSGEGRPYKTVFGVLGVSIRPGRLHLD